MIFTVGYSASILPSPLHCRGKGGGLNIMTRRTSHSSKYEYGIRTQRRLATGKYHYTGRAMPDEFFNWK